MSVSRLFHIMMLLAVSLPLLAGAALAEVKTTTKNIRALGYGATPHDAVQDALVQAVQQHKGVHVDSRQVQETVAGSFSKIRDGKEASEAHLGDVIQKQVATKTKGDISGYTIVDQGVGPDGRNWAEVETTFCSSAYVNPGLPTDKRRRFAVYPFNAAGHEYFISGRPVPGVRIANAVTDAIIAQLVQSRKFAVLQRQDMAGYSAERALLSSSSAGKLERLKLGKLLGADYLLTGDVMSFNADTTQAVSALTGERFAGGGAEIVLSYELMLMATQEIKWADTVAVNVVLPGKVDSDSSLASAFDTLGNRVAMDLLENIYPPKIVALRGAEVQLNMGGKSYAVGDTVDVFALGPAVVDPYTKESLGPSERFVMSIVISRVTPKTAYAHMPEGGNVRVGMICRRHVDNRQADETSGKATTDVQSIQGGGVKLPFD